MGNKNLKAVLFILIGILLFTYTLNIGGASAKESNFNIENGVLKQYLGSAKEVVIPAGVTAIGNEAFQGNGLEKVTISDGVKLIADRAFQNCSKLTEIVIPESVTNLGMYAFQGCSNLLRVELSSRLYVGMSAFEDCVNLKEVIIPDGVNTLSFNVFKNCTSLEMIDLPESISFIGRGCFENCTSLETILFPMQETYIGYKAFYNTLWLNNYDGDNVIINHTLIQYLGNETDITIPDHIRVIGDGAYENCFFITKIKIPKGVKEIGISAFSGCTGLTEIVLPDSVETVGASSFYGCNQLVKINVPKLIRIRRDSLEGTKWMSDYQGDFVILNGNLLAYKGTASKAIIPDTVTAICTGAFQYKDMIEEVIVPESVTTIYYASFLNCENLMKVYIKSKNINLEYEAFLNFNKNMKIYGLPGGAVKEYASSNNLEFISYGLNKTKVTLYLNGDNSTTLRVNGIDGKEEWKSENTSIAAINNSGKVTAVNTGTTKIYATVNGIQMTCKITVKNPYMNKSSLSIRTGLTSRLNIIGVSKEIIWSSSNTSVASVNSTGVVTAKNTGSTTITAKCNGKNYTCKVIVDSK